MKMKNLVKTIIVCLIFLCNFNIVEAMSSSQLEVNTGYVYPKQKNNWTDSNGFELKYTLWCNENIGIVPSIGYFKWKVNEKGNEGLLLIDRDYSVYGSLFKYVGFLSRLEGKAKIIPLGLSAIYKNQNQENRSFGFSFEAGIKYMMVDSEVKAELIDGTFYKGNIISADRWIDNVKIENSFVGNIGINLEIPIQNSISLLFGSGYQFDFNKGNRLIKSKWNIYNNYNLGKNELEALCLKVGVVMRY